MPFNGKTPQYRVRPVAKLSEPLLIVFACNLNLNSPSHLHRHVLQGIAAHPIHCRSASNYGMCGGLSALCSVSRAVGLARFAQDVTLYECLFWIGRCQARLRRQISCMPASFQTGIGTRVEMHRSGFQLPPFKKVNLSFRNDNGNLRSIFYQARHQPIVNIVRTLDTPNAMR